MHGPCKAAARRDGYGVAGGLGVLHRYTAWRRRNGEVCRYGVNHLRNARRGTAGEIGIPAVLCSNGVIPGGKCRGRQLRLAIAQAGGPQVGRAVGEECNRPLRSARSIWGNGCREGDRLSLVRRW